MYFPATLTKTGWNGVGVHFTFPVHSFSAYRTAKVTRNKISLASGLEYNFITSESVRIFATDRSPGVLGSDEHQMPQRASLQPRSLALPPSQSPTTYLSSFPSI